MLLNLLTRRLKQISIYAFCCLLLASNSVLAWSGSQVFDCKNMSHLLKTPRNVTNTNHKNTPSAKSDKQSYNYLVNNCDCDCCNHINHSLFGSVNSFSTTSHKIYKPILIGSTQNTLTSYIAPHDSPPI